MRSALLQSMMQALLLIRIIAAREASPLRGLEKALVWFTRSTLQYVLALRFVYPSLS